MTETDGHAQDIDCDTLCDPDHLIPTCSCGWTGRLTRNRAVAERAIERHAAAGRHAAGGIR